MATCSRCRQSFFLRRLNRRLAIPEYRAMIGYWPWLAVRVCDACAEGHDRDFLERLRLLGPQVLESDEPIAGRACLACGTTRSEASWRQVSKWIGADDRPVRRATFFLCSRHSQEVILDGMVVASNLAGRVSEVLADLPCAGSDLLERVEGWRPGRGAGPAGADAFSPGLTRQEATVAAEEFWGERPANLEARGAWLGPVRKDYRMRYRLDLARDSGGAPRETLTIVRTGPEEFVTYRTRSARPRT